MFIICLILVLAYVQSGMGESVADTGTGFKDYQRGPFFYNAWLRSIPRNMQRKAATIA